MVRSALLLLGIGALPGGHSLAESAHIAVLDGVSASRALASGIEVDCGTARMQVTALRDNVLRVRVAPQGTLPEDASWAVLPSSRTSSIAVTPESDADGIGFRTAALRVRIDRASMRLHITDLQGNVVQEDSAARPIEFHGNEFRVTKAMPGDEHYFGLGDKVGPLDRRGMAFAMWNSDTFGYQESTDPIYKSIPFFLTVRAGRAAGVLLDNTWRTTFDFGKQSDDEYSFGADGGPLDYYVLYGPEPKHVLETYAWLTGPTPLPPLWSLGFQQSRYSYMTEAELRAVAERLRADRIPADALYLDIDYQQNNRPFTVDEKAFPNFAKMVADLRQKKFHLVVITDLHIAYLPNAGYAPYDSGAAGDHFVKRPDGSTYIGRVWPGPSAFPDFTQAQTRQWWGTLYGQFMREGVAGFWNDMNEPAVFDVAGKTMPEDNQHRIDEPGFARRTASHREIHNVFGMENSRATYEGLRALDPDQRPFVLTRASYAGGQRYAATWTGDNSSTWNHLRLTTPMLLNLGLSGFAMSGADAGGFAGTPPPDLLTKWLELAAFQPIDRDHTAKGTAAQEPWVHGPEQEAIRRRYIEERYRLMPYLYTAAEEMSRTGLPIVRPLFLEFPHAAADGHPLDLDAGNEFLFGADLLVAPAPYPEELDDYEVQLPPGIWYDYWTGERFERRSPLASRDAEQVKDAAFVFRPVVVHPTLEALPVYVRGGAIVPEAPLTQSTMETPQGPLTLRVYPGAECSGSIYLDDGESYAYTRGGFAREQFTCSVDGANLVVKIAPRDGSFMPWWKDVRIEIYDAAHAPRSVAVNGASQRNAEYDLQHRRAILTVPDNGSGAEVRLESVFEPESTAAPHN